MYKLIRNILFLYDPEVGQHRVAKFGHWLSYSPFLSAIRRLYHGNHPSLQNTIAELSFCNPVGVAAGFDKLAELSPLLEALGFGFVEVGTVVPKPQPGNARPRLFRLPKDKAIINRMGFNSEGVISLLKNLTHKPQRLILGVNIGKNKDTPNDQANLDYEHCFSAVADHTDYIAVNVSSPNTPGLRELQAKESLHKLLGGLQLKNQQRQRPIPIFLKIAPDITNEQLDDIIKIVKDTKIAGIIATNTTISRKGLNTPQQTLAKIGEGGLSGPVLKDRSTEIIRYIYKKSQGAFVIIGVGGIYSAEDAYEKIKAGASLVQIYTAIIYEGPGLAKKINKELVKLLRQDGFKNISEAIGTNNNHNQHK